MVFVECVEFSTFFEKLYKMIM